MSGVFRSSAFGVGKTKFEKTPDNVLLILTKAKFWGPIKGAVDVQLRIPNDVQAVAFGDRDSIIWRRAEDGGRSTSKFFQEEWDYFCAEVDRDIRNELAGKPPPIANRTWPEYWEWRINKFQQPWMNPEKRIDFINTQRRKAGLPPIN